MYGDLQVSGVTPDKSLEVHGDFNVCALSAREIASSNAEKERWIEDRVRGIHYPSLLNVRRAQCFKAMDAALKANTRIVPRPIRSIQTVQTSAEKCKNCTVLESVIPPGLSSSDWLPIVNLRRAERCERQRPIPEQAAKARTIIVDRMLRENAPHLSVPTSKKNYRRLPGPSSLSKINKSFAIMARFSDIVVDEEVFKSLLNDMEDEFEVQPSADDSNSMSDMSSDFFR